jgi:signal transduction histidine kinase
MHQITGVVAGPQRETPPHLPRPILHEVSEHLRAARVVLYREWVRSIWNAGLLRTTPRKVVFAGAAATYDRYVAALETGAIENMRAFARSLSELVMPRGADTREAVGIILLLRDVLGRFLQAKYRCDRARLRRVLDAYEPAANRIVTHVAVGIVTERYRNRVANVALHRTNERLEAEVRRIAHSLHDEAGPLLVAVHMAVHEAAREAPSALQLHLTGITNLLHRVEDRLRDLSHELRPPMLDEAGLSAALRFLVDAVSARKGPAVQLDDRLAFRLPAPLETAAYRVVQEALANICRHANASRATISLYVEDEELHCIARDDGIGIQEAMERAGGRCGLGLVGMRERVAALGGTLNVGLAPGRGTELHAAIPLEAEAWRSAS